VHYPHDPMINGTKINSPHYLTKINAVAGTNRYVFNEFAM
jgi:hypothetical protein